MLSAVSLQGCFVNILVVWFTIKTLIIKAALYGLSLKCFPPLALAEAVCKAPSL